MWLAATAWVAGGCKTRFIRIRGAERPNVLPVPGTAGRRLLGHIAHSRIDGDLGLYAARPSTLEPARS